MNALLLTIITILSMSFCSLIYYSELVINGENYRSSPALELTVTESVIINDRKKCEVLNKDKLQCCHSDSKQKLKNILGCL